MTSSENVEKEMTVRSFYEPAGVSLSQPQFDNHHKHVAELCFFCVTECRGFIKTEKKAKLCVACVQKRIGKTLIFSPTMVLCYKTYSKDLCDYCCQSQKSIIEKINVPEVTDGYIVPCCNFDLHLIWDNATLLSSLDSKY